MLNVLRRDALRRETQERSKSGHELDILHRWCCEAGVMLLVILVVAIRSACIEIICTIVARMFKEKEPANAIIFN